MEFWNNRNVLVTGCTGFLGGWLSAELVRRRANVIGLVRDVVPHAPFFRQGIVNDVTVVRGSIEDYEVVERAINEHEVDTVIHLAAQAIVGVANRSPLSTFETNIKGTWTLLEACRQNSQVSRIVVASSDKAYGSHADLPYKEDFALQGRHPYDVSKSCTDLIALMYHNTYRTPVSVTRCGNIFGPGDVNYSRIVPGTIRSILNDERPIIRSDGAPIRDYVFVDDIVDAYLLLAQRMDDQSIHGRAFNIAVGEPVSVLELTQLILKTAGREDLEPVILNEAKGEIVHQYLSSELVTEVLGWRPGAPLEERLLETYEWHREHLASAADSVKA